MSDSINIAIIGGGAAGLATAIFAAEAIQSTPPHSRGRGSSIVVFDGAKKIGAKILVSGGGRCNVTHDRVSAADFNGPPHVVRNVLAAFNETQTAAWFESLGVSLKREDTGKLFPVTDDANTVLDALLRRCDELGVEVRTHHRVIDIKPGFEVQHTHGTTRADQVVMATGGRSLPKTGSDGAGWSIVKRLGHTVAPTYPALVPLVLDDGFFHASISGVSHEAELSTFVNNKRVDQRAGSLLWTHFGISGPVAMDASRFWVMAHAEGKPVELRCNFAMGKSFEQIDAWLADRDPRQAIGTAMSVNLPRRLVEALCHHAGLDTAQRLSHLPRDKRRALAHAVTGLKLPVARDRGWNYAEVTAGGVPMSEVDFRTMKSRITDGLYLVGEMLDVDGRIGGFNFQWAWSTGKAAGAALGTR